MNETRRRNLLIAAVLVLVVLNLLIRRGEDSPAELVFDGITDLETAWSPATRKTMDEIAALPELSFRIRKQTGPESETRNPFIFGADRIREAQQQHRLAEVEQARVALETQTPQEVVADPEPAPPTDTFDGKVLGVMENSLSGETKVSVLYMEEYHVLEIGETLDERYKLLRVSPEQIRFLAIASGIEINIPMESY